MDKLFSERQHFTQIWLWVILTGINGLFLYGLVEQFYFGQAFGNNPASNGVLLSLTIITFLFTAFFAFIRLETAIDKKGVHYRFYPFQLKFRTISWDRISKAYIRQYRPIGDYGGWGIRMGLFGKGKAYNVSGNKGLQLVYDDGKMFILGTQRADELRNILDQLEKLTENKIK
jgi:hypothetical protein